jgi:hypothetical protein
MRLPFPVPPTRVALPVPANWCCNAKTEHKSDGACSCSTCYVSQHPKLKVGPPVSVNPSWPMELLLTNGLVGLYDSIKEDTNAQVREEHPGDGVEDQEGVREDAGGTQSP